MIGLPGAAIASGLLAKAKAESDKETVEIRYKAHLGMETSNVLKTGFIKETHTDDLSKSLDDWEDKNVPKSNFQRYYDPHEAPLIFKEERNMMLVKRGGGDWEYSITLNNYFKLIGLNRWYAKRMLTKKMI